MTADTAARHPRAFLDAAFDLFHQAAALAARLVLGFLMVLAAGVVAVAMATAALLLAGAAIVFRFTRRPRPPRSPVSPDGITLEARRTARGWTVE